MNANSKMSAAEPADWSDGAPSKEAEDPVVAAVSPTRSDDDLIPAVAALLENAGRRGTPELVHRKLGIPFVQAQRIVRRIAADNLLAAPVGQSAAVAAVDQPPVAEPVPLAAPAAITTPPMAEPVPLPAPAVAATKSPISGAGKPRGNRRGRGAVTKAAVKATAPAVEYTEEEDYFGEFETAVPSGGPAAATKVSTPPAKPMRKRRRKPAGNGVPVDTAVEEVASAAKRAAAAPQAKPVPAATASTRSSEPQLTTMRLDRLVDHPLQHAFNPPCTPAEDAALAEDLARNGQREPIHVMPPGNAAGLPAYTKLDGHRRANALRSNGAKQAKVLIRHDLKVLDAAAVEAEFLAFNRTRRHYEKLAWAKSLVRTQEIAKKRQPGRLTSAEKVRLAEQFASFFKGMSARNAQRWIHAANTPNAVQEALRKNVITLVTAAKIDGLPRQVQEELASKLAAVATAAKARAILGPYLDSGARPKSATSQVCGFLNHVASEMERLHIEDLCAKTYAPALVAHEQVVHRGQTLFKTLAALLKGGRKQKPAGEALRELLEGM